MDTAVLKRLVEIFWNESVSKYTPAVKSDKQLNELLLKELYDTYNLSQEVKILTDINININGVLALISDKNNLPLNLKRLAVIEHDHQNLIEKRQKYGFTVSC